MYAEVGDMLVIEAHTVGGPRRDAEILEVRGPDGAPPYLVRWSDTGHEALVFPGPDAHVKRIERTASEHSTSGRGADPPRIPNHITWR